MSPNELVELGADILPVARVCDLLDVPRSSLYERRSRRPSRVGQRDTGSTTEVGIGSTYRRPIHSGGSPTLVTAFFEKLERAVRADRERTRR